MNFMPCRFALMATCWLLMASPCRPDEPLALLDLKVGREQLQGRIAAHNDRDCWLLGRDGRLSNFRMDDVTDFSEAEERFRPFSALDLRDRLQTEFGRGYEVHTTPHYLVVAQRGASDRYGKLFERVYRQCHTYFSTRGFRMAEPEFPLVAIVFPDQAGFAKYCRQEGTVPREGLVGFYLTTSNRVALYDREANGGGTAEDVDDTVIHEATHQIAFNTGIHSRIGQNPQWIVEGIATVFEAEGMRSREAIADHTSRLNLERSEWFRRYRRERRPERSLESFLRDDGLFRRAPLDAYSQAWALTYFLIETRPVEFSRYLKTLAARDPLVRYDAKDRLVDFQTAFGRDVEFLEQSMLRYHDRVE